MKPSLLAVCDRSYPPREPEQLGLLKQLAEKIGHDPLWLAMRAFTCGRIQGKREEKARRKKRAGLI